MALLVLILSPALALAAAAAPKAADRAGAAAPSGAARASLPADAEARLREAIWSFERRLRSRLETTAGREAAAASAGARDLSLRLRHLRRLADQIGGPAGESLARKTRALRPLLGEIGRLEASGAAAPQRSRAWLAVDGGDSELPTVDATRHASCEAALPVRDGHWDSSLRSPQGEELWLRYAPALDGWAEVTTAGSDFDSTIEVYSACPTDGGRPLATADDELGLQARAGFVVLPERPVWIRIAGWHGAAGELAVSLGGGLAGIEGTVIEESSGQPLFFESVEVWDAGGAFAASTFVDSDGLYSVLGLAPGNYFVSTQLDTFNPLLNELYDDLPCPGGAPGGCDPTSGTPVVVAPGSVTSGIDFALGPGAVIAGRVRDAATGEALRFVAVSLFNQAGSFVGEASTDAAGRYSRAGFGNGQAFAWSEGGSSTLYQRQLYEGIPCPGSCDPTTGTPIPTTVGATTFGIDFELDPLGTIEGRLTDEFTGETLFESVDLWTATGGFSGSAFAGFDGVYRTSGLEPGDYFVSTSTFDYRDEVYDDIPCLPLCAVLTGDPVPVVLAQTTGGIDFALRELGTIRGTVVDEVGGQPVRDADLRLWDGTGGSAGFASSGPTGLFFFRDLLEGTYFVTAGAQVYVDELYDDLPCPGGPPGGCDPTTGTPVVVPPTGGTIEIEVDLVPLGAIEGRVTETGTGAPVANPIVLVWDGAGNLVPSTGSSNANGEYRKAGLPTGTYTVTAFGNEHVGELYQERPCPGGTPSGCDVTLGDPVSVSIGATVSGIDFTLDPKGSIAGTVLRRAGGQPVDFSEVKAFDAAGLEVSSTFTDAAGSYRLGGLETGTHFVLATAVGFNAQLYDDLRCPPATCDPTTGTPVAVILGQVTSGIDFALDLDGSLSGRVVSTTGEPVSTSRMSLYDAAGNFVADEFTSGGSYAFFAVESGVYFLVAEPFSEYEPEVYDDIPCPAPCDPTTGTPIPVASGVATGGIDFELAPLRGLIGRVVDAATLQPMPGVGIDLWDAAGSYLSSTATSTQGFYRLTPGGGTYFVSTDNGQGAVDEIYDDVPCPLGPAFEGLCDPTTGQSIVFAFNALVEGIDFALAGGAGIFADGFESGNLSAWSAAVP